MNTDSFYRGMYAELQKNAQSTQVTAAGPTKPQPQAAPRTAPAPNIAPHGGSGGILPAPTSVQKPANTEPPAQTQVDGQPANVQPNQPQQAFSPKDPGLFSRAGLASLVLPDSYINSKIDSRFDAAKSNPGAPQPEISQFQQDLIGRNPDVQKHLNQRLGEYGAQRISDTNLFDGAKALTANSPAEAQLKEYGLHNPDVQGQWAKAVQDKTYGVGTLDDKGEFSMNKDLGKNFQGANFMKDHWGKILMALLGVGALGWMGNRGNEQQPIVINNNNGGGGSLQSRAQAAIPGYGG